MSKGQLRQSRIVNPGRRGIEVNKGQLEQSRYVCVVVYSFLQTMHMVAQYVIHVRGIIKSF